MDPVACEIIQFPSVDNLMRVVCAEDVLGDVGDFDSMCEG